MLVLDRLDVVRQEEVGVQFEGAMQERSTEITSSDCELLLQQLERIWSQSPPRLWRQTSRLPHPRAPLPCDSFSQAKVAYAIGNVKLSKHA